MKYIVLEITQDLFDEANERCNKFGCLVSNCVIALALQRELKMLVTAGSTQWVSASCRRPFKFFGAALRLVEAFDNQRCHQRCNPEYPVILPQYVTVEAP